MKSIRNSVRLVGNLGKDLELKDLGAGRSYVKGSVAINNSYQNAKGEMVKETQWHNFTAWGKTAELMSKALNKGSELMIEGQLSSRSYQDKDNQTKYITDVVVDEFIVLNRARNTSGQD